MFPGFDISCVTFVQKLKANIWTDCIMKVGSRVSSDAWNGDDQGFLYWLNWFIGKTNCSPGIQGLFQDLVEIPRNTCSNSRGVLWCDQVEELMIEYKSGLKMLSPTFEPGVVVVRLSFIFDHILKFRFQKLNSMQFSPPFRISIKISICAITEESQGKVPPFALGLELIKHKDDMSANFVSASVNLNSSQMMVGYPLNHCNYLYSYKVINIVPLKCFSHKKIVSIVMI